MANKNQKFLVAQALVQDAMTDLQVARKAHMQLSSKDTIVANLMRARDILVDLDEYHPLTAATYRGLSQAYVLQKDNSHAISCREMRANILSHAYGLTHPETAHAHLVLGLHLQLTGASDYALEHLELALFGLRYSLGETHSDTVGALYEVGLMYERRKVLHYAVLFFMRAQTVLSNRRVRTPLIKLVKDAVQRVMSILSQSNGPSLSSLALEELVLPVYGDLGNLAELRQSKHKYGYKIDGNKGQYSELASQLGLTSDDLIVGINSMPVSSMTLAEAIATLKTQPQSVTVRRVSNYVNMDRVVNVKRPETGFGMSLVNRTGLLMGSGVHSHVMIEQVISGSYAEKMGLAVNDQLLCVNGQSIEQWPLSMVLALLLKGEVHSLTLRRAANDSALGALPVPTTPLSLGTSVVRLSSTNEIVFDDDDDDYVEPSRVNRSASVSSNLSVTAGGKAAPVASKAEKESRRFSFLGGGSKKTPAEKEATKVKRRGLINLAPVLSVSRRNSVASVSSVQKYSAQYDGPAPEPVVSKARTSSQRSNGSHHSKERPVSMFVQPPPAIAAQAASVEEDAEEDDDDDQDILPAAEVKVVEKKQQEEQQQQQQEQQHQENGDGEEEEEEEGGEDEDEDEDEDELHKPRVIIVRKPEGGFKIRVASLKNRQGFRITSVEEGGYGQIVGLKTGDVIIAIDEISVSNKSDQEFMKLINKANLTSLTVMDVESFMVKSATDPASEASPNLAPAPTAVEAS